MNDLLGRHARDVITGFTGVITGYVRYLVRMQSGAGRAKSGEGWFAATVGVDRRAAT